MTTVFTPIGNQVQVLSIADDSSNFNLELTRTSGSFGSAVQVTNLDVGNVVFVNLGWDEFETTAVVPAVGAPGEGVPVLPGTTTTITINTTSQSNVAGPLYLAAAVTGTADITVVQGLVN